MILHAFAMRGFSQSRGRLLLGPPIVGDFCSPALIFRETLGEAVTDDNIRAIARQSRDACYRVNANSLSTEGGAKSMEKRRKEFATGSYIGTFEKFEHMCDHMEAGFREIDGCEDFVLDRSLVIAVPEFVVEEHDRVLNSAAMVDSAGRPLGLQHQGGDISGTACPPIGYVQVFPRIVRILIQMLRLLSFVGCRFFSHVQLVLTCMRGRLTIRLRIDNNRCCRHIQFSPAVAIRIQR